VREKSQEQLDLQACHRVRSRLVSRRTATINQIRAFLIEQGIAVRAGVAALRNSLFEILKNREDDISPRMSALIVSLYEDWLWLDERIETITKEIEQISQREGNCIRLMSVPRGGPLISTAVVAAIGTGEAFDRGRDFGAWLGLVPRQYSTGGRSIHRAALSPANWLRDLSTGRSSVLRDPIGPQRAFSGRSGRPKTEENESLLGVQRVCTTYSNHLFLLIYLSHPSWAQWRSGAPRPAMWFCRSRAEYGGYRALLLADRTRCDKQRDRLGLAVFGRQRLEIG
jgi:hypothetical protein